MCNANHCRDPAESNQDFKNGTHCLFLTLSNKEMDWGAEVGAKLKVLGREANRCKITIPQKYTHKMVCEAKNNCRDYLYNVILNKFLSTSSPVWIILQRKLN